MSCVPGSSKSEIKVGGIWTCAIQVPGREAISYFFGKYSQIQENVDLFYFFLAYIYYDTILLMYQHYLGLEKKLRYDLLLHHLHVFGIGLHSILNYGLLFYHVQLYLEAFIKL